MTTPLNDMSERDLQGALGLLQSLAEENADPRSFVSSALDKLPGLVPSDLTTLSVCDLARGTRTVFARRGETLSEAARSAFDRHFRTHPLVRFHGANPRGPTQRISDCLDHTDFINSPVYADYYRRIGIRHVMALPLRIDPGHVISIVFNRSSSNFRDRERAMLEGVRPALAAFYRDLVAREEAQAVLSWIDDIAADGGWQMLRITASGRILEASPPALRLLRAYFAGDGPATGTRLPAAIQHWLSRSRSWGLDRITAQEVDAFRVPRAGSSLTIRYLPDRFEASAGSLLLKEERHALRADHLRSLPLTRREREVLVFVAAGKTNAEIAALLGNSARTVQKHLEHIFRKLGVETRTAAAVKALAAARLEPSPP